MLKLGCMITHLAYVCLHKSEDIKIYPFTEGDKNLLEWMKKMFLVAPYRFLGKAVIEETSIRKWTFIRKCILENDASQPYHYSITQSTSKGLDKRWDHDPKNKLIHASTKHDYRHE